MVRAENTEKIFPVEYCLCFVSIFNAFQSLLLSLQNLFLLLNPVTALASKSLLFFLLNLSFPVLREQYYMVQKLGGGGFGTVYMVQVTFSSIF